MLSIFTKIADFFVSVMGMSMDTNLGQAVHFFVEDTTKIFFLLFLVTGFVSFFRSYLNPEKVRDYLAGKPKWLGYLLAVILGAITPFCSCSSIPLFIGFIEAGIPFGITMAFLITSPLVNEVAVVILGASLGWNVTIIYVLTGMAMGFVGGLIMDKLGLEKYVESYIYNVKVGKGKLPITRQTWGERTKYAFRYSVEIIDKVWPYVLFGIGIGAFLHGFVPSQFFVEHLGSDNLFAVPMAVLAGIPMYSNATGIIPIAQVLLAKGLPLGTVFAIMMSVVAISLPELIILRKVMTLKLLVYFVALLFVMISLMGYLYNAIL